MQEIDLLLRGAALGSAVLICIGVIFAAVPYRKAAALVTLNIFIACYLVVSAKELLTLVGPAGQILLLGAILAPAAFTWAVLEILFDDIGDRWVWIMAAVLIAGSALFVTVFPIIGLIRGVLTLSLYAGLLILVIATGPDDLVEERRRFRRWFVVMMSALGVIISAVEIGFEGGGVPDFIFPLQAGAIFAFTIAFGLWAFSFSPEIWPSKNATKRKKNAAQDNQLINLLDDAMEQGVWREEGLTIGALAEQLGVAEHRLRTAINQDLDFRNFSTFINSHRIIAAMKNLDDPKQTGRTILEIAYDIGFASLGPFNKAFRAHTGLSPREYRNRPDKTR